jgi:hypothetical protein
MVVRPRADVDEGRESGPNWVLIGLVGLSIEFWIVLAGALAERL